MVSNYDRHRDDEEIERYSLNAMQEAETAEFEGHLLVCETCRQRLDETEAYIAAVREAGTQIPHTEPERRTVRWWVWAGGLAAVAAAVVLAVRIAPPGPAGVPAVVELRAYRDATAAEAPAGAAVRVKPDLSGLAAFDAYRVQLVDQSGAVRWQGQITSAQPAATLPGQPAGVYFVRVFSPSGELLREYALRAGR